MCFQLWTQLTFRYAFAKYQNRIINIVVFFLHRSLYYYVVFFQATTSINKIITIISRHMANIICQIHMWAGNYFVIFYQIHECVWVVIILLFSNCGVIRKILPIFFDDFFFDTSFFSKIKKKITYRFDHMNATISLIFGYSTLFH